jgi:hypothetical protein
VIFTISAFFFLNYLDILLIVFPVTTIEKEGVDEWRH